MSETFCGTEWFADDNFWAAFRPLAFSSVRWDRAAADVDGLLRLLNITDTKAVILDLCCGPGRYALELAQRGLAVTAVDLSDAYLAELHERYCLGGQVGAVEIVKSDMRVFKRLDTFDGAICVGLSFGYLSQRQEDIRVLKNVYDLLRPGGSFVLEVPTPVWPDELGSWYVVGSVDEGAFVEQSVDSADSRIQSRWHIRRDGEVSTYNFSQRLFNGAELLTDLESVGFEGIEFFGSYDAAPLESSSRKIVAIARKRCLPFSARA